MNPLLKAINDMRKVLVYTIIALVSIFSVLLANYAMVYHFTAKVVTSMAVLITLASILQVFFHPNGWAQREKHFLSMWMGPLLYSIHKVISPISIFALLFFQTAILRFIRKDLPVEEEALSVGMKWKKTKTELLTIAFTFFVLDVVREYTVWEEISFRWIPAMVFMLALINFFLLSVGKNNPSD